jgi:hypothetical protein
MTSMEELREAVRVVLLREWDPLGVRDKPMCCGEYDSYAPAIGRLLQAGVDEFRLAAHLGQLQRVAMGLSLVDEERNRAVARRLRSLLRVRDP